MDSKSPSEKSKAVRSSKSGSPRAQKGLSQSRKDSLAVSVLAEMERISPASVGQLAAPILDLLNLMDLDQGGAEMIGTPIYERLWDGEGVLRQPFKRLVEWYLETRPSCDDPQTVAGFVIRCAAVVACIEHALRDKEE